MKKLAAGVLLLAVGCGPTGQVRVERHIVCDAQGTQCQAVDVAKQEPSASDRIWQFLFLLALANSG